MAGRKSDFTLTKLDDLFTTQAQRDEEQLSKIRDIPLELIDDFPDHPFKVRDDEDMMQLVESVKERGVITPATVRQKEDGRYGEPSGQGRWLIMCPYWLDMCPCKKSLKVQEKSFQACVCLFECNRVEKRTKFRKLEPPGH